MGYFVILTEEAPQIASGKEYGARAGGSCDAGLFPHMLVGFGYHKMSAHAAKARPTVAAWSEMDNELQVAMNAVVTGEKTAQEAMDELASSWDILLK